MAYQLQFRRDTASRWSSVNPILADAEIGYILDNDANGIPKSSLYKIGDGKHKWNELPIFGFGGNVYNDFSGNDLSTSVASRQAVLNQLMEKLDKNQLVQALSPNSDDTTENPEFVITEDDPLTVEEFEKVARNQTPSRWVILQEFQGIWDDFSTLENRYIITEQGHIEHEKLLNGWTEEIDGESVQHIGIVENVDDILESLIEFDKLLNGWTEEIDGEPVQHKGIKDLTEELLTDVSGLKVTVANHTEKLTSHDEDIRTLKTRPNQIIMSQSEFENLQADVESGSNSYEDNTLYFIYEEEINQ